MSRRYAEPAQVRSRDGEPAEFRWRGRLYAVRSVLAQWVETGAWWEAPAVAALLTADAPAPRAPGGDADRGPPVGPLPSSPRWGERTWGEPAPEVGTVLQAGPVDDVEREWWRVEAARVCATGVYDLCLDSATGHWTVARVLD